MKDLLAFIRPPEGASHKEVNRWRWNVCLTLLGLVLFSGWSLTKFGFAVASDVDKKMAAEIAAQIAPIQKEFDAMKREQGEQRSILDQTRSIAIASQAADYEGKILDFKTRQCKASKDEAAITWRDLVLDYQKRYYDLTGKTFPAPSCADL